MLHRSFFVLLIALLSLVASIANADIVTLKDGTVYEGVITEENGAQVTIVVTISNIKTTKTFPRYKVNSIEYQAIETTEEESADDNKSSQIEKKTTQRPAKRTPSKQRTKPTSSQRDNYIVIPVQGTIGEDTNAYGLKKTLQLAVRRNIKHIVFTIDSPGGYVYDAIETLKVLKEYDDALIYHALVEEGAISAASVYVAAADDIFVRPNARVGGAATSTQSNSSGAKKEADAKLNSIWATDIAAQAESKGYPAEIFRAMVEPDAEVWMDHDGKVFSSRPSGSKSAQQIDSNKTLFTIRAAQMVQVGMAKEFDGTVKDLSELLDVNSWNEIKGIGTRSMIKSAKERVALQEKMEFAQKIYSDTRKEYTKHHPASYSDYLIYVEPKMKTNMPVRRSKPKNSTPQDAESVNRWRNRTRETIKDIDIMIEALEQMASVTKSAQRIGARHIGVSESSGADHYKSLQTVRSWLYANMNRIPVNEDRTIESGPDL